MKPLHLMLASLFVIAITGRASAPASRGKRTPPGRAVIPLVLEG